MYKFCFMLFYMRDYIIDSKINKCVVYAYILSFFYLITLFQVNLKNKEKKHHFLYKNFFFGYLNNANTNNNNYVFISYLFSLFILM